tara:strand:+ start:415 stop:921 length:507 start_codon:yes stop_codon:yes gene_type:complete
MKFFRLLIITLFIIFSSLTGITYAESLKFDSSTYEGEVKKGNAHGVGIFTFTDGSTYEGKVSKNRIHGKGIYTDSQGKVFEGKFRYGTMIIKIDKKTRGIVKIKPKTGFETYSEIKGTGAAASSWFMATQNSSGTYELTAKGKADMAAAEIGAAGDGGSGGGGGGGGC